MTLGSYLGAIKNWGARADEFDCFYFMADMHTITVRQTPAELRRRTLEQVAQYIACGLDPERNTILSSPTCTSTRELAWVLECYTMFGELSRMTQFKDKSAKHADNINAGLFTYPCLMAADILLYQPTWSSVAGPEAARGAVPGRGPALQRRVQRHLHPPRALHPQDGARVMSLGDPSSKMSKSDPDGCVFLMDAPEVIQKKFKRAVTDSETQVRFDPEHKPGISNLLTIYCAATGKSPEEAEEAFQGQGYGVFKPRWATRWWSSSGPSGRRPAASWPTRRIWRASTRRVRSAPPTLPPRLCGSL